MGRNILKSTLENASFNITLQILFRCVTFVVNAWIIRNVGHEILGIMNVRLLLLESTILFLSREPFTRTCLGKKDDFNWYQIINQIWLSVPLSCVLTVLFIYIWINFLPLDNPDQMSQYQIGCWSIGISCILELCFSNLALVAQLFCFVKLKVVLDAVHVLTRTLIFVTIIIYDNSLALIAFSIAQVVSILVILVSYYAFFYWYIGNKPLFVKGALKSRFISDKYITKLYENMDDFNFTSLKDFMPKWMGLESTLNKELSALTISFAKQGVVKQILTEGEKYVMSASPVLTFSEQAIYDVVNNLGSIAARFILRPIEDSCYFYFTQMISRELPLNKQDQNKIQESCLVLSQICKTVGSVGLVILVFGQSYASVLLLLYAGDGFLANSLPVLLLRSHCFAMVLLAINGITECYASATMTSSQLNSYNYFMVLFSFVFLVLSYVLTYLFGPVGFIMSNCINMSARILHSIHYINKQYKDTDLKPLNDIYVGKVFMLALLTAGCISKMSEIFIYYESVIKHILVGMLGLICVIIAWVYDNRMMVKGFYSRYSNKETKLAVD